MGDPLVHLEEEALVFPLLHQGGSCRAEGPRLRIEGRGEIAAKWAHPSIIGPQVPVPQILLSVPLYDQKSFSFHNLLKLAQPPLQLRFSSHLLTQTVLSTPGTPLRPASHPGYSALSASPLQVHAHPYFTPPDAPPCNSPHHAPSTSLSTHATLLRLTRGSRICSDTLTHCPGL